MDRIHIRDLTLRCMIGVTPAERLQRQDVVINVAMDCDLAPAARADRIEETVDYRDINSALIELVEGASYNLLEALAERIAEACLSHEGVRRVQVSVDKPGALQRARSVAVDITREKH